MSHVTIASRTRLWRIWLALVPVVAVLWYFPFIDFAIRVLTWMLGLALLIGAFYFAWKHVVLRWVMVLLAVSGMLFVIWPSPRKIDEAALRRAYCEALASYRGCRYVWGGEGYLGIDCSGFVRKAMEDALAKRAIMEPSPSAFRAALSLYWQDTNARVIGEGYGGRTREVATCSNLNVLDYTPLQPGDLAVTLGGDHIMAYLGNKTWIAADPSLGKVAEFHIPEKADPYFWTGMRIVRWTLLER